MKNKLSVILTTVLAVLLALAMQPESTGSTNTTAKTTGAYGCFRSGLLWKDLGTDESIYAAYDEQWCKYSVGLWALGVTDNLCIRDDPINHAFRLVWEITEIPDGQDAGYVSHDVCVCFLAQVLNLCERGGSLDLVCGPGTDGGDIIGAVVTADPQTSFNCH